MDFVKKLVLLFGLLLATSICSYATTPSISQLNSSPCFNSSSTSLGCSLPSTMTAGDTVVYIVTQGASTVGTEPTGVSGCSATWVQAEQTYPFNDMFAYTAYNVSAASCTATATFSGATQMTGLIYEITGVPSNYTLGVRTYSGRNTSTINFQTQGNFLALASVNIGPGGGTCNGAVTISGWTTQSNGVCNPGGGAASMDTHGFTMAGAAGSYSFTPNWNNSFGINPTAILLTFRDSVPSPGRNQFTIWSNTHSKSYDWVNQSGSVLVALCGNDAGTPPTDTQSNVWLPTPLVVTSDSSNQYNIWYAKNANAGSNTVTCSGSASTVAIELFEYSDLSTTNPLGATTVYFTDNTSISTIPSGNAQANSSSVMFSIGAIMQNTSDTMTASSGWVAFGGGDTSQNNISDVINVWDQNVTPGSYANNITPSAINNAPQAMIMVLESSPVVVPVLQQRARASTGAGSDGSRTASFVGSVTKGDLIVMLLTNQTTSIGPGTPSDSISDTWNTYFSLGTANGYALYWTVASSNVSAGSYTATNTSAQCIAILDFTVSYAPAQDVYNTATNLSGASSLGTGNAVTTQPNDLLISFSTVDSAADRLLFTSQNSGWSALGLTCGGHDASLFAGWQPEVSQGTYSNLFTWANSMPITATIASFKIGSGFIQPLAVNVISKVDFPNPFDSFVR